MSNVFSAFYVNQGGGYWEEIGRGWDLGNVAPLLFDKWNKPIFEWRYTKSDHQWSHYTFAGVGGNAAALAATPPPQPQPSCWVNPISSEGAVLVGLPVLSLVGISAGIGWALGSWKKGALVGGALGAAYVVYASSPLANQGSGVCR